ncbi:hypothetical protein D5S18_03110 [Nocardia panacis]|uniref:DNA helicase DnaB-like N-terminal domain-containing protein n=1 Tax=Nocardia panacis TaxID=2340916 RepID=A0A3A4KT62_9NOCA|nr:AAA family ATPase [Nocardia panacis]RJO79335.1 hypothetical protein D5S18_03110 [Nocardia panacis]
MAANDPSDPYAERQLIGLALVHADQARVREAFQSVRSGDWTITRHTDIAAVLSDMLRDGIPVSAVTVHGELVRRGTTTVPQDWLTDIAQEAWQPETAPKIAETILRHSANRTLVKGLRAALADLESPEGTTVHKVSAQLRAWCERAESTAAPASPAGPTPMGEFLSVATRYDWLVAGLLERGERLVLTGSEGGGKSVLCSQIAACIAGGIHPFTAEIFSGTPEHRVLVIDCENSAAQSRRRYGWITRRVDQARQQVGADRVPWSQRTAIEVRPAGIDLLNGADVAWLESHISAWQPDVLVLGPLYKLHHQDPSSEPAAREIAWVIDGLRERYQFAVITEAHSGNGTDTTGRRNMRPIGSSLWRRWPEYGFGLAPKQGAAQTNGRDQDVDVVAWRGSREERCWPNELRWGETLPWRPEDEYFDRASEWSNNQ